MTFRRAVACLLALVLCLACIGCSNIYPGTLTCRYDTDKYIELYENKLGYNMLDDQQKKTYGALYTALVDTADTDMVIDIQDDEDPSIIMQEIGVEVRLAYPIPVVQEEYLQQIRRCLIFDNPQFFYVNSSHYGTGTNTVWGEECYTTLSLLYSMDAPGRAQARKEMDAAVAEVLEGCPDTTDEYTIQLYLHDRLLQRCTYDNEAAEGKAQDYPIARTAYGPLVEGKAVCGGYTLAMTLLLQQKGIASTYVVSLESQHVWNLVRINGNYYHMDATWNDSGNKGYHHYFNCTTEEIAQTRVLDTDVDSLPPCEATVDNFYRRSGVYAVVKDSDVLAEHIASAVKRGDTFIEINCQPETYEYTREYLRKESQVRRDVNAALDGTGHTMWNYRLYSVKGGTRLYMEKS